MWSLEELNQAMPFGKLAIGWLLLPPLLYLLRWLSLPKPIPGIPYNVAAAQRIMGDVAEFRAAPNRREWWADMADRYQSPLVQVFLRPFGRPWVFIADYHEAADISMRRTKEFDRSRETVVAFNGVVPGHQITLRSADPQFKKNKELVRDLMTPTFLHQVSAPHMHNQFSRLVELWSRKLSLSQGRPFDVSEDIHNVALDIIMVASFGLDMEQTHLAKQMCNLESKTTASGGKGTDQMFEFEPVPLDDELQAFAVLTDSVSLAIRSPAPRLHHFLYRNLSSQMRRAAALRDGLRDREITKSLERAKAGLAEQCAMDQMLAREHAMAEKEGRKADYYSQTITSELLGYLVAGHDTTSSAVRWGMKYLTDDQRVQTLLREAFHAAYPQAKAEHRAPTVTEIIKAHVPYFDATLEEMMRHARPAPVTLRDALVDTQILGVHIPKGTTIGFLANGPSVLRPTLPLDEAKRTEGGRTYKQRVGTFDAADIAQFLPERWLRTQRAEGGGEETVFDQNAGPAQAFGMGPRGCFGKRLSYVEMRIFYTLVIWEFKLLRLPEALAGHEEAVSMTRFPKHVYLKLEKVNY